MKSRGAQIHRNRCLLRAQRNTRWAVVMIIAILAQSLGFSVYASSINSNRHYQKESSKDNFINHPGNAHTSKSQPCHGMNPKTLAANESSLPQTFAPDSGKAHSCCEEGCNMSNCHGFSAVFNSYKPQPLSSWPPQNFSVALFHASALLPTPYRPPILATLG